VDRTLEARVDLERFAVTRGGKTTLVRPQPISVDPEFVAAVASLDVAQEEQRLRKQYRLGDRPLLVGVDRVDYIKGIPERLRAVERLLDLHPELKETFTFVQIGAPSRVHIPTYRWLNQELSTLVEEINWRQGTDTWRPIVYLNEYYSPEQVYALYRMATGCVVSSLHDGMNLVAKEFVAARSDGRGVLVLSRFTGAARELTDALLINPYAMDEFAEALRQALVMPVEEQEGRMRRMRQQVADNNIYRWAGMLLSEAGKLVEAGVGYPPVNGHSQPHFQAEPLVGRRL
jgi:trehalose 6-phosphate synthase